VKRFTTAGQNKWFYNRGFVTGDWTIQKVEVVDSRGNTKYYYQGDLDALNSGWKTVTVTQPTYDVKTPPELVEWTMDPIIMDLTMGTTRFCANVTLKGDLTRPLSAGGGIIARSWAMFEGPVPYTAACTGGSVLPTSNGCAREVVGGNTVLRYCTNIQNFITPGGIYVPVGVAVDDGNDFCSDPDSVAVSNVYGNCNSYNLAYNNDGERPPACYARNKNGAGAVTASFGLAAVLAIVAMLF
jgi:hypothetical protein